MVPISVDYKPVLNLLSCFTGKNSNMIVDMDFHVNEFIGFIGVILADWLLNESVKKCLEPAQCECPNESAT